MEFLSAGLGLIGLGVSIFGSMQAADTAKEQARVAGQQAGVSSDEALQEQGINDAKQASMELSGRRQNLENLRNMQKARAQAVNSATQQGAQFGSGVEGGLAEITNTGLFNISGVNNALETGRTINQFNKNISADRMQMASLGGQQATLQGDQAVNNSITSLGGAIMKAGPTIGAFSKGFGSGSGTSRLDDNGNGL